jgi:tetratricopeptide (TPR) repeat protein
VFFKCKNTRRPVVVFENAPFRLCVTFRSKGRVCKKLFPALLYVVIANASVWASPWLQDEFPDRVQADLLKDLRGLNDEPVTQAPQSGMGALTSVNHPGVFRLSVEGTPRITAEGISASRLKHAVPREARKAYSKALHFASRNDPARAMEELDRALSMDSDFFDAQNLAGIEKSLLGDHAAATAHFGRALSLDPNSPLVYYNLTVASVRKGDFTAAERTARECLKIKPTYARAQLVLGYILLNTAKDKAEAIRNLELAAATLPEAKRLLRREKEFEGGPPPKGR